MDSWDAAKERARVMLTDPYAMVNRDVDRLEEEHGLKVHAGELNGEFGLSPDIVTSSQYLIEQAREDGREEGFQEAIETFEAGDYGY
jgi:hypothetical protein